MTNTLQEDPSLSHEESRPQWRGSFEQAADRTQEVWTQITDDQIDTVRGDIGALLALVRSETHESEEYIAQILDLDRRL